MCKKYFILTTLLLIYRFQTKTQLTFAKIDKIPDMVSGILFFFLVYG